ncbi:SDR family NAD(P)-dependent oxidoreductase [Pseudonocardia alni]|uniref:SDR family NAD(P)-dependent oxidoreductase n=1 Tax=Pseudonocardia alni TaxID=33907 RepID=UPI00280B0BDB|nr:SDR family NAD(P)-dependent oxidoreductase [Pseudonocardia alni]
MIGFGPGLGMSVAHRFGREGFRVALVSRSSHRHEGYVHALRQAGVEVAAFAADVTDPTQLRAAVEAARERFGRIDVAWYGPGGMDGPQPGDITGVGPEQARAAFEAMVSPAIGMVGHVLPEMRERSAGALLFAGGISSVIPLPPLGALALSCAALRNYALTLNAALARDGVYAGTLTVGGLIARGDIHTAVCADPALLGGAGVPATLDPDELADTVWELQSVRSAAEAVVPALT